MFFFMLLYLVLVLVRPQDYPQWADVGLPLLPVTLALSFLFWLPRSDKQLWAPQYVLVPVPAKGKFACRVTMTVNGTRVDDDSTYPTAQDAIRGGLERLRARLGW